MVEKQEIFTLMNGKIKMFRSIYNPTSDAVWLASFSPIKNIKSVLDIGIGTGGVSLCLGCHLPNAEITGIDISNTMLEVCKKNIDINNKNITLINEDIFEWESDKKFDLVITNPPYFYGTPAKHNAHHNVNITEWVKKSIRYVKPNGYFCIITDALAITKVLYALENKHFGDIQILPLFGAAKNTAERVLIRAKLGVKTGSSLYSGLSMNNESILRSGLTIDELLATLGK